MNIIKSVSSCVHQLIPPEGGRTGTDYTCHLHPFTPPLKRFEEFHLRFSVVSMIQLHTAWRDKAIRFIALTAQRKRQHRSSPISPSLLQNSRPLPPTGADSEQLR
jgi:hypothetical protein